MSVEASIRDPIIDQTRAARQALVEEFGSDLRRLAEHLHQVQQQYDARLGPFAGLPREAQDELFPNVTRPTDPGIAELRTLRGRIAGARDPQV